MSGKVILLISKSNSLLFLHPKRRGANPSSREFIGRFSRWFQGLTSKWVSWSFELILFSLPPQGWRELSNLSLPLNERANFQVHGYMPTTNEHRLLDTTTNQHVLYYVCVNRSRRGQQKSSYPVFLHTHLSIYRPWAFPRVLRLESRWSSLVHARYIQGVYL